MKRLLYLLFITFCFYNCKSKENISIVGEWKLYNIKSESIVIDSIASNIEKSAITNVINTIHTNEDSIANERNISVKFTDDFRYFWNGEEQGTYTFDNYRLTIKESSGQHTIYDTVLLNKHYFSYSLNRTQLFRDSVFLHSNGLADTISSNLIQKVTTRYSYKK